MGACGPTSTAWRSRKAPVRSPWVVLDFLEHMRYQLSAQIPLGKLLLETSERQSDHIGGSDGNPFKLVAEELAQETFLVAYRDWNRISGLDNPRAWVRKVAINQRSLFLRAYLRQQTRDRDAVARDEEDRIKLADDHAEVWQAVRTLPPLQAQVIALHYYEDYSVAQVAAALGKAPGTIKAQLPHGRRKLARLLGAETDRRSSL
jgi:RNA polymerase sigma factor (sigma-70 family)